MYVHRCQIDLVYFRGWVIVLWFFTALAHLIGTLVMFLVEVFLLFLTVNCGASLNGEKKFCYSLGNGLLNVLYSCYDFSFK
uniref:Uncharacterized protein n=1 Tax=Rhizophora mucronata TaxID=61149 RepID=A0A2P2J5G1_RHIMU